MTSQVYPPRYRSKSAAAALWALALFGAEHALAQVQIPNLPVPPVQLPDAANALTRAQEALDPRRLRDLRQLRVRELLRRYPRELEAAEPRGSLAIRGELIAHNPTAASLQLARAAGFQVVRESNIAGLDIRVVVLRGRPGATARSELRRLRRADRTGSYDYNHLYIESGQVAAPGVPSMDRQQKAGHRRVGLIDTGVDRTHPSLLASSIHVWGCDGADIPGAHGTAVASLLVGDAPNFSGAVPRATLYAADVYCGRPGGGSVEGIAQAFGWLAQEQVPVINVSLVGPPNALLEQVVHAVLARGHLVVAAVGNDGPSARPLYPAAYPDVIGVTAVDTRRKALVEALRGPQVDFAAPGVEMAAATTAGDYAAVRGTSFAAPLIAGLLADGFEQPSRSEAHRRIELLNRQAIDLGARGRDKVYGNGLLGEALRVSPVALGKAERKR